LHARLLPLALLCSLLVFLPSPELRAQAQPAQAGADTTAQTPGAVNGGEGPAGIIPSQKGYNLSLGTTSQHDSSNGWSSLLTPDVAFRFNSKFSVDAVTPIYTYINVLLTGGTTAKPTMTPETRHFSPGDTSLNGHFETSFPFADYDLTATLGLPTGEKKAGLGAGQVTYNVNNHLERSFGLVTPDVELGIGDASDLVAQAVRKSYTSVGPLAYFQAGVSLQLPRSMNFSADAYEELPLANETVYSTTGRGKKKKTTAHNAGPAEDNGFLNELDIPLNRHATLTGFYNRSLRSHIDTAGFSLTFLLKGTPEDRTR
jgi:hypothetical protein